MLAEPERKLVMASFCTGAFIENFASLRHVAAAEHRDAAEPQREREMSSSEMLVI
jgi:hypothetical protein